MLGLLLSWSLFCSVSHVPERERKGAEGGGGGGEGGRERGRGGREIIR